MSLAFYLISELGSLRQALTLIEANQHGIIFTTDCSGAVVGVATDGDIRRRLLAGGTLDDRIESCANPDFVWAD